MGIRGARQVLSAEDVGSHNGLLYAALGVKFKP